MLRLGAPPDGWNQAQRSECVEIGLAGWKIPVAESRGFRFLGSVALQGGLPMKLLAAAHGNIGLVLSYIFPLLAGWLVGESEIEEWIGNLSVYLLVHISPSGDLPTTDADHYYRTRVEAAALDLAEGAIDKLDTCDPDRREKFPLPIEDDQARGRIQQLVKDAATTRVSRSAALAAVDRTLEFNDCDWHLRSTLELPEYAEPMAITQMFGLGADPALPRLLVLRFSSGERTIHMESSQARRKGNISNRQTNPEPSRMKARSASTYSL